MSNEKTDQNENDESSVEFHFPLLLLKVSFFESLFDKLGKFRVVRAFSWFFLGIMPAIAVFSLYMVLNSLHTLLTVPLARDIARDLGPQANILLPGVTPYLPILYGLLGLIVAMVAHEGAHGIVAKMVGLRVRSSGLVFLLVVPFGAFVDVDEDQLEKAESKNSLRVLSAGSGANLAVALLCLIVVFFTVSGLSPVADGLYVTAVLEGMPAEEAGVLAKDFFVRLEDQNISSHDEFAAIMETKKAGDTVSVVVARGENWMERVSLVIDVVEYDERPVLGVNLLDTQTQERLQVYLNPKLETIFIYLQPPTLSLLPFSRILSVLYSHPIGDNWYTMANAFFWLWFINVNLAIFNTLPIYPLDGGRIFEGLLKTLLGDDKKKSVMRITYTVTIVLVSILVMNIILPYIF